LKINVVYSWLEVHLLVDFYSNSDFDCCDFGYCFDFDYDFGFGFDYDDNFGYYCYFG